MENNILCLVTPHDADRDNRSSTQSLTPENCQLQKSIEDDSPYILYSVDPAAYRV